MVKLTDAAVTDHDLSKPFSHLLSIYTNDSITGPRYRPSVFFVFFSFMITRSFYTKACESWIPNNNNNDL